MEYHEYTKINAKWIMKKKKVPFGNVHLDDDRMIRCAVCEHGDKSLTYFKLRNFLNSSAATNFSKRLSAPRSLFSHTHSIRTKRMSVATLVPSLLLFLSLLLIIRTFTLILNVLMFVFLNVSIV